MGGGICRLNFLRTRILQLHPRLQSTTTTATTTTAGMAMEAATATTPSLLQVDNVREFWAERWSGPKLGWHKDDINPHLMKYNEHIFDTNDDCSLVFVPLCGKSVDLAYLASHPKVSQVVGIDILRTAAEEFAAEHPEVSLQEVPSLKECESPTDAPIVADAEQSTTTTSCSTFSSTSAPINKEEGIATYYCGKNMTFLIRNLFDFLPMTPANRAKYLLLKDEKSSSPTKLFFDTIFDRAALVAIQPTLRQDYVRLMGELLRPGGTILLITFDRRVTTTESAKKDGPPFSIDEGEVRRLYETQSWVESVTMLEEVDELTTDADRERWMERGVVQLYEIVFLITKKK